MLVSIIIPTHNRLGKVCRALDSVLKQSYQNIEVIVVDDGSTDGTREWLSHDPDPRLKYFWIENGGVAHARNFGVAQAQADWICFLDSDDVWRKHKLSEQLRYHAANRDCLISQTDDMWIRNSMRVNKRKINLTQAGDIFAASLKLCLISCSCVMLSKKLFLDVGGFDDALPACEDYDLWLRITAQQQIGFVDKKLVTRFGGHADQLSKTIPHLDQYRVVALKKLLGQNDLTETRREWVEDELERKMKIIQRSRSPQPPLLRGGPKAGGFRLYIASKNPHKAREIQQILSETGFVVRDLSAFKNYEAPEETGKTFVENARIKAQALHDFLRGSKSTAYGEIFILADDSGLVCDALAGAPGVLSARFAGVDATDVENNAKLVREFQNIPSPTGRARFVCALVLLDPNGAETVIEESCAGVIVTDPKGENGFGYDPHFYLAEFDKTMAELDSATKNQVSHRAKALTRLLKSLESK